MDSTHVDVVVVGRGLVGSAAARHLSDAGVRTTVIGPDEPVDPAGHDGPFGSHYDEGRLAHRSARKLPWSQLAAHAMAGYAALEARSGVSFSTVRGTLTLERVDGEFSYTARREEIAAALGFSYQRLATPAAVEQAFPLVACPAGYHGLLDPQPAGFINPRALLRAQLAVAAANAALIVNDVVVSLRVGSQAVQLTTRTGRQFSADAVILATGAHLHSYGLLAQLPPLTVKSEVVTLAEVDAADVPTWQQMPPMLYDIIDDEISEIYLVPPVRYPDGRWYLKLGSNAASDLLLHTHDEIVAWMRSGDTTLISAAQARAITALFPHSNFRRFIAKRCMISRTVHGLPYLDELQPRIVVAAGCNGSAAKSSDALGELASLLVRGQDWPVPFRREDFRLPAIDRPSGA